VQAAFAQSGDKAIAALLGAFAFAHWDEEARRLTLARDCLGQRSLFYHRGDGFVVFASYLPDLLAVPGVPRAIDETMAAKFLAQDHNERERTLYRGIDRVASRTCVVVTARHAEIRHYWAPRLDAPPAYAREEDLVARGRELFDRAVARCLGDVPRAAVLTSGGFDSSAIAATAARQGHGDITCYTGLPPDDLDLAASPFTYFDERPPVEALARMHPALRLKFVTPRGMHPLYENCMRLFERQALPAWGPIDKAWFYSLEDAIEADGHRVVLDGAVGNYGLSWAGMFSLAALARRGKFLCLLREAHKIGQARDQPLGRVLREDLFRRIAPRSLQRLVTRLHGDDPDAVGFFSLLNPAALDTLGLRRHWKEDRFDPRSRRFGDPRRFRAGLLFDKFQISRDIRAMSPMLRGYELRDPHADRELLEFCLTVPETLYRRDGLPRWYVRQVFADRLPAEILRERRRGAQNAGWFETLNARRAIIESEIAGIAASPMADRLIDVPRLKRLVSAWPENPRDLRMRAGEYRYGLDRACHFGQFLRWVEQRNA
jgi:asparagine synthase (glutamine-hydrolysing)